MNDLNLPHRAGRVPRRRAQVWLASLLTLFVAGLAAHAAVILDLPEITLQPNQANQSFVISVQNTGASVQFNGVTLNLVIGNGSSGGPAFQAVTLLSSGSLFAGNNNGDLGVGYLGSQQIFQRYTSTSSGTVTLAPGTFDLATVTFDTTGLLSGVYSWSAANSPNGMSYFTDTSPGVIFSPTIFDGTLTVVPEPIHVALPIFGGIAGLIAGVRRWSRRQARAD